MLILYTLFALIGLVVVAKFLFTLFFPLTAMRIRLAFLVRALTRLTEQQVEYVDRQPSSRSQRS